MIVRTGRKLICQGYVYGKHSERDSRTHWRCTKMYNNGSCKARAISTISMPGFAKLSLLSHNHPPHIYEFLERNKLFMQWSCFISYVQKKKFLLFFKESSNLSPKWYIIIMDCDFQYFIEKKNSKNILHMDDKIIILRDQKDFF